MLKCYVHVLCGAAPAAIITLVFLRVCKMGIATFPPKYYVAYSISNAWNAYGEDFSYLVKSQREPFSQPLKKEKRCRAPSPFVGQVLSNLTWYGTRYQ